MIHTELLLHNNRVFNALMSLSSQARTLMALTHAFYSDPRSFLKVHEFNHEPQRFNYAELLRDLGHSTGEPT